MKTTEELFLFSVCYIGVLWVVLEVLFYVAVHFYIAPELQEIKEPAPFHRSTTPGDTLLRVLQLLDHITYDFEDFVYGFFRGAKLSDLKQDNIRSFLSWAVYNQEFYKMSEDRQTLVDQVYTEICFRFKISPEPGHNPEVKHVCMTMEPIAFVHRPLFIYVCTGIMELMVQTFYLRVRGFRNLKLNGMKYWIRPSPGGSSELPPLVILHGITPGWFAYSYLVHSLLERHRTCILVDVGAIKINSLNFRLFSPEEFAVKLCRVLERHKVSKCSVVGHSFGSITAGWFVQEYPEMVSHLTLIDPVTLLLAIPAVAYNFLYRPPASIVEYVIRYMASRELTISNMLHRHFWWYRNTIWLEDVPRDVGVVVALSEDDTILDATAVREYVERCQEMRLRHSTSCDVATEVSSPSAPISAIHWPGFTHGQFLLSSRAMRQLCDVMHHNEKATHMMMQSE